MCKKFKTRISTGKRDDQSAISSKEHVKYEATQTYSSVTYRHDRLHLAGKRLQQRSQGSQQQKSTPSSKESSRGRKNTKRVRCDTGRTHATHWFVPWILSTFTTTFAWRSLTTGGTIILSLMFCVESVWYTFAPCHKICHRQKAFCV